jgi:hypothetical protein
MPLVILEVVAEAVVVVLALPAAAMAAPAS